MSLFKDLLGIFTDHIAHKKRMKVLIQRNAELDEKIIEAERDLPK